MLSRLRPGQANRVAHGKTDPAKRADHQTLIADAAGGDGVCAEIFGVFHHGRQPFVRKMDVLRADAKLIFAGQRRRRQRFTAASDNPAAVLHRQIDNVHRRRADEAGGKGRHRVFIELAGRPALLDMAFAHQDDAVGHAHGLGLVMGDKNHGDAQPPLQRADFIAHFRAQLGVEVGQRFIEQADGSLGNQRAPQRHPLLLPAGELIRAAFQQRREAQKILDSGQPFLLLVFRHAPDREAEQDVFRHIQMGKQGIGLEHHRQAPFRRRQGRHLPVADMDLPRSGKLQPGNQPQRG